MPNVNIYIPNQYLEILEQEQEEGESLGQTAKRLLLAIFEGRIASYKTSDINLQPIEQRLEALEQTLEQLSNISNNAGNVTGIEERLEALERDKDRTIQTIAQLQDRLVSISEVINDELKLQASLTVDDDEPEETDLLLWPVRGLNDDEEESEETEPPNEPPTRKRNRSLSEVITDELKLRSALTNEESEETEPPKEPPTRKRGRPKKDT